MHLFGEFRLEKPDTSEVELRSPKLETLLTVLVINSPHGLSRKEICEIVWPETNSKQSLRQAIYSLRKFIGQDSIESSLDHCRLSDQFLFTSDYHQPELRTSTTFMPGSTGEWFDRIRCEVEGWEPEETTVAADSFTNSLMWLARHDVRGFYSTLRSSANIIRGIPFSTLRRLSKIAATTSPELKGWSYYWRGTAVENLWTSEKLLQYALDEAQRFDDRELASEVTLELGKVYARLGKPREAMCVASICGAIAQDSSNKKLLANNLRLKGTILTYYGQAEKGIRILEESESFLDDTLGMALARSSRAFFLASAGRTNEALATLDWPLKVTLGLGHTRIGHLATMTQAITLTHHGQYDHAVKLLTDIVTDSRASGFTQFGVCAADMLHEIYLRNGDRSQARAMALFSQHGRDLSLAIETPLDRIRRSLVAR